jgi:glycosyltransferase involved in cell wall biosynthesis
MSCTPRVSIGMPVYNGARFLRQALDSILAQTFEDFELIISDNSSSDGTEGICREYAADDARIRYSRNSANIGMAQNFNRVFRLSSGEYFRWSSADDVFDTTSLEQCVQVLDEHPEVVLSYPRTVLIDADGRVIRNYDDNLDLRFPEAPVRLRSLLHNIALVNAQYGLIRRAALRRTSLLEAFPGSDITMLAELSLYGQFWELPQRLLFRRMHDEASSAPKHRPWDHALRFWSPASKGRLDLYHWIHRFQDLRSISRSPLSLRDKVRSTLVVGHYAFRSRHIYLRELQSAGGQLLKRLTTTSH